MSKPRSAAAKNCQGHVASSEHVSPKRGVAVSLFSGAGGLDLGAERAGYQVRAAVEYNRDAADTMEKNFTDLHSPVIRQNILEVSSDQVREAAGLGKKESPELLIGGPPCTPFSKSSFWLDWKREGLDPNASLLQEYTRVLRDLKPRYFVLENVYALTYNNKQSRPHFERLLKEIDEYGYDFNYEVLNAANYGVPQARPRLVIVGAPKGSRTPTLPLPTHGGTWERQNVGKADTPHVTSGQALAGLKTEPEPADEVGGQWGRLLKDVPPGDNYLFYTAKRGHKNPEFEWRSRYWSFLLKLDPNKPSPTIQAQPGPYVGPFHWEGRRLRVAELKRLFTFPDEFELVGSRNSIQAQLGNSVPPDLAEAVVRALTLES
ncbi:DNA cytosine methyltransferase [Lentzea chajnantorensis]